MFSNLSTGRKRLKKNFIFYVLIGYLEMCYFMGMSPVVDWFNFSLKSFAIYRHRDEEGVLLEFLLYVKYCAR